MQLEPRTKRQAREGGFTLVELLISIVILAVIMVPLTGTVIQYFRSSATTGGRLTESHDEQIVAAYWQQDVSSIGVRLAYDQPSGTFPYAQSVSQTSTSCSSTGTLVVALSWDQYDTTGAATLVVSAYYLVPNGARFYLIRVHCVGAASSMATVARDLTGTPSVACAPISCSTAPSGTYPQSVTIPTTVNLTMSVSSSSGSGQAYTVTLTGQRRQT